MRASGLGKFNHVEIDPFNRLEIEAITQARGNPGGKEITMNIDFNQIIQKKLTQMEDDGVIQKKIEAALEKSIMDAIESELGSYSFRNALGKQLEDGVSIVAKDCGLSAYNSFLAAKVKDIISGIASDDLGKKIETAVSGVLVQRYDGIKLSDIFKRYRENVMESASDSEKDDRQTFTMELDAHGGVQWQLHPLHLQIQS